MEGSGISDHLHRIIGREHLLELRMFGCVDDWIHTAVADQDRSEVDGEFTTGRDKERYEVGRDANCEGTNGHEEILSYLQLLLADFAFVLVICPRLQSQTSTSIPYRHRLPLQSLRRPRSPFVV